MKLQSLKKRLLVESVVIIAIVGVLGGGVSYLDSIGAEYTGKSKALEGEVNTINSQTKALREKFSTVQKDSELYHEIMTKSINNELSIDRLSMDGRFRVLRDRFYLDNPRVSVEGVEEMKGAAYKRDSNVIVSSVVTAEFNAVSDMQVYNLIRALQQELPGGIKVTKLEIRRNDKGLTEDVLRDISIKGSSPVVKVTLKFVWLGIKSIEKPDSNATKPKL